MARPQGVREYEPPESLAANLRAAGVNDSVVKKYERLYQCMVDVQAALMRYPGVDPSLQALGIRERVGMLFTSARSHQSQNKVMQAIRQIRGLLDKLGALGNELRNSPDGSNLTSDQKNSLMDRLIGHSEREFATFILEFYEDNIKTIQVETGYEQGFSYKTYQAGDKYSVSQLIHPALKEFISSNDFDSSVSDIKVGLSSSQKGKLDEDAQQACAETRVVTDKLQALAKKSSLIFTMEK